MTVTDALAPKSPLARFDVTEAQIRAVVDDFYRDLRNDDELGPVFRDAAGQSEAQWAAHIDKIHAFWCNAILHKRGYSGSPMMAHSKVVAIQPEHFDRWLWLFAQSLKKCLPEQQARQWMALVLRIGKGLRSGVEMMQRKADEPPILR